MEYNPNDPAQAGVMALVDVICSMGSVNSRAHGRFLLAIIPQHEYAVRTLLANLSGAIEVFSAVLRARYFNQGHAEAGKIEDFPPILRDKVAEAILIRLVFPFQDERKPTITLAVLPNYLVQVANEPTPDGRRNVWPLS